MPPAPRPSARARRARRSGVRRHRRGWSTPSGRTAVSVAPCAISCPAATNRGPDSDRKSASRGPSCSPRCPAGAYRPVAERAFVLLRASPLARPRPVRQADRRRGSRLQDRTAPAGRMRTGAGPNACHPHQAIHDRQRQVIASSVASATTTRSGHSLIAPMVGTICSTRSTHRRRAPEQSVLQRPAS